MANRDIVVLLDKSGSMGEPNKRGVLGLTRWQRAQESIKSLARKGAETDPDGIDVYSFNTTFSKHANTTPEKVQELFDQVQPYGGTSLVPVLQDALAARKGPTTIVVLTDGEPQDAAGVAKVIIGETQKMEGDAELAIGFIQVGDDAGATKFLKGLDDDLQKQGAKFDIVDVITADELDAMTPDAALAKIIAD